MEGWCLGGGFILEWNWDGQDFVYTIEQLSPEDDAALLTEEQEE